MRVKLVIILICAFCMVFSNEKNLKKAYIITGPESSGSRLITRVVAHVLGKDRVYNTKPRGDFIGKVGRDEIIVLHRSQPSYSIKKFYTLDYFRKVFEGYKLYFIITTRDMSISGRSKIRRFRRTDNDIESHALVSKRILSEILRKENCFIWSYETQMYLKEAYFEKLYEFMGVKSNYIPPDLYDGNKRYLKR